MPIYILKDDCQESQPNAVRRHSHQRFCIGKFSFGKTSALAIRVLPCSA